MRDDRPDNIILLYKDKATGNGFDSDPAIVDMLETFLAEAKKGEIDGLAIAVSRPNDSITTGIQYGRSMFRLAAAVNLLSHDVAGILDDTASRRAVAFSDLATPNGEVNEDDDGA